MSEQSHRWRRTIPVAALTLATAAGLVTATTATTAIAATGDLLGASGPAKGAATAPAPTVADDGCTLAPSLTQPSDDTSCIGVGATLSAVPALGRTARLTVTVRAGRVERATAVTVDLPTTLAFADGTASTAAVNGAGATRRATLATVDLARGETRTWTRTVTAVRTGFGEITARALAVVDPRRTDGGADQVHLTVGRDAASTHKGAPTTTGDGAVVPTAAAVAPLPVTRPSVAVPTPAAPPTQVTAKAAAPGTTCATGRWVFVDQAGVTRGVYQARVQIWRGGVNIAGAFANGNGDYTVCWASGGTTNSVYVRFVHTNNAWKVTTNAGNDYAYNTGTVDLADGATGSFGTLQPADSTQFRALHAYYDAAVMYDWIYQNSTNGTAGCWNPYGTSCRQLAVTWQNDNGGGANWDASRVYLAAASPDSEDVPIHEYNHEIMYDLYGFTFPATSNCSPHSLFLVSSTTCAWTEGYADWAVTSVWNNTVYTYSNLATDDFNRTWGDPGDTGDQVEGRIVQALDSLNDGAKYPFDNISGPGYRTAVDFWTVMRTYRPTTFGGFWSGRGAAGQDVGPASSSALFQGTIDYGFRNPLADAVPKAMPRAIVPHNYSFTTTRGYWSVIAVRPADGSDSDLTLYSDAAQGSALAGSAYGGTTTDFVAVNSNSGARPLQTYYPRVNQFAGTDGYLVEGVQGTSTFSTGALPVTTNPSFPAYVMDSYQTVGVPVYYRAVPRDGQSVGLTFLTPGQTVLARTAAVNSAVGTAGQEVSLVTTPTATGYGGLVLTNQGLSAGTVSLYADTTAPGGTISLADGAASTNRATVPVTLAATDDQTGVVSTQLSTDGTFDTEDVVPYATSATVRLAGVNGDKTVAVRYLNNAGMWSAPVSDTITLLIAPSATTVAPASGPAAGGTTVTVRGTRFTGASSVQFGTRSATNFTVVNDSTIRAISPAGGGTVPIKVTVPAGTATSTGTFRYVAPPVVTSINPKTGPAGTTVTVNGANFTGATKVQFGTTAAVTFTVVSDTRIRVTAPAGPTGVQNIRVTTAGGLSTIVPADRFTYTA